MKIVKNFKVYAIIPAVILVAALIVGILIGGFNLGIDFTGGTLLAVEMGGEFDTADVEAVLNELGITEYTVAQTGELGQVTQASIRIKDLGSVDAEDAFRAGLIEKLLVKYPQAGVISTERVGAVAGATLVQNALWSVLLASALMLAYIWIRFELVSGVIAIAASILNVLLMLAAMIFCSSFVQINSSFIAACLTIVGYSINNTIIVLDRIREENRKHNRNDHTRKDVAELSVHKCLGRMINTTITSLLTITCLFVLGVDSIREFALPLIIGIACGTYISIFLVPAMWGIWMDSHTAKPKKRRARTA